MRVPDQGMLKKASMFFSYETRPTYKAQGRGRCSSSDKAIACGWYENKDKSTPWVQGFKD